MVNVSVSDLDSEAIPTYEDVLSYLLEDQGNEIMQKINQDKQALSNRLQNRTLMLNILDSKLEHTTAASIFSDTEYFVNCLCSVLVCCCSLRFY